MVKVFTTILTLMDMAFRHKMYLVSKLEFDTILADTIVER